jgi:glycosyltransferase involved in cell wall biosynthesis
MRVAIDASSLLAQNPRGEGKTLLRLYEEIAKLRPDWSFIFIGDRLTSSAEEIQARVPRSEIRVIDLPGYRWNLWENLGLPLTAWRSRAQLLHCASSGAPRWSPLPVVMTVHDVIPLLMNDDPLNQGNLRRFRSRLMAGIRCADKIIAVSDNTRQDLSRTMNLDPARVEVVHWGADLIPCSNAADGLPRDTILGFGGGGSVRKNTPILVRMFAKVAAHHPTARLVILGVSNATQRIELQNLIDDLSLQGRVNLRGYVSDSELDEFYRGAACLVYVSLYEGFGLPPLEAMARGLPVVASNRSSIPEVVSDAGILVDPESIDEIADASLKLLTDLDFRQVLCRKAWHRAQQFSWRDTAEKTINVFESA